MAKKSRPTLKAWKRKLERCNKYYQTHGYYYNSNPKKKGGKSINCCGFAFRCLYHFGIIPKSAIWAYTKRGRLVGQGAGTIKKKCIYKTVDMPIGKAIAKGIILPGDIVGYRKTLSGKWASHTEVYKGKCRKGGKLVLKFYNYGPNFRKTNGVEYRALDYAREVGCFIRIRDLDRKSNAVVNPVQKWTGDTLREKIVMVATAYMNAAQGSAKHKALVDLFNKVMPDGWPMTYSAPWCACFASAIAIKTFGAATAKKYFPLSANCGTIIAKAKKMDIWKEADNYAGVKPGDWILYDWDDSGRGDNHGSPDHVGIVSKVIGQTIHVIEGNKGTASKVGERLVPRNGRYIRGFVLPKYETMAKNGVE